MPSISKFAAVITLAVPMLCQAGLTGTSVTGSLRFVGPKNFFDPANGMVPTGVANTASNTVNIADPGTEFGFQDSFSRITADFTNLNLTIAESAFDSGGATIERFDFFNSAFTGRVAVRVSNSYPVNPTVSLVEDGLSINFPDTYDLTAGNTTAITFALTLPGDADLNGTVNFNDFLALQNNFGQPNTTFQQGNFNGDGQTDFNDFLALQNNFGQSVVGTALAATSSEVKAMTAFAAAVPEPTTLAGLGLAGLLIHRRSRRSVR